MLGNACWLEVNTNDAAGAKAFYTQLFGWEEQAGDVGFPYHFLRAANDKDNFGGIMPHAESSGAPPHWLVYFAVADVSKAMQKVEQLGGKICLPIVTMPQGKFAIVSDPQGATFAVYENLPQ